MWQLLSGANSELSLSTARPKSLVLHFAPDDAAPLLLAQPSGSDQMIKEFSPSTLHLVREEQTYHTRSVCLFSYARCLCFFFCFCRPLNGRTFALPNFQSCRSNRRFTWLFHRLVSLNPPT